MAYSQSPTAGERAMFNHGTSTVGSPKLMLLKDLTNGNAVTDEKYRHSLEGTRMLGLTERLDFAEQVKRAWKYENFEMLDLDNLKPEHFSVFKQVLLELEVQSDSQERKAPNEKSLLSQFSIFVNNENRDSLFAFYHHEFPINNTLKVITPKPFLDKVQADSQLVALLSGKADEVIARCLDLVESRLQEALSMETVRLVNLTYDVVWGVRKKRLEGPPSDSYITFKHPEERVNQESALEEVRPSLYLLKVDTLDTPLDVIVMSFTKLCVIAFHERLHDEAGFIVDETRLQRESSAPNLNIVHSNIEERANEVFAVRKARTGQAGALDTSDVDLSMLAKSLLLIVYAFDVKRSNVPDLRMSHSRRQVEDTPTSNATGIVAGHTSDNANDNTTTNTTAVPVKGDLPGTMDPGPGEIPDQAMTMDFEVFSPVRLPSCFVLRVRMAITPRRDGARLPASSSLRRAPHVYRVSVPHPVGSSRLVTVKGNMPFYDEGGTLLDVTWHVIPAAAPHVLTFEVPMTPSSGGGGDLGLLVDGRWVSQMHFELSPATDHRTRWTKYSRFNPTLIPRELPPDFQPLPPDTQARVVSSKRGRGGASSSREQSDEDL